MNRSLKIGFAALLIVALLATTAFAYGEGFGNNNQLGTCLRETLSGVELEQFDAINENFREEMLTLRERVTAARETGDSEAFGAVREERFKLMEERRAALEDVLPDEYAERFANCGQGMRNFGADRGNSGFSQKFGNNR